MSQSRSGYDFRAFSLEDIPKINLLYFEEYGHHYPYPLKEENVRRRNIIGSVAIKKGEVVGFARACPYAGNPQIFEFGGLIVKQHNRHRTIARILTEERLDAIIRAGAKMVFSEPVCNRPDSASQFNLIERGFRFYGILPFKYPEIMLPVLGHQPETVCLAIKFLETKTPQKRPIFAPPDIQTLINELQPLNLSTIDEPILDCAMPTLIWHEALTTENQKGSCFVDVPANWPGSLILLNSLRNRGFRFACFMPSFGLTKSGLTFDYITLYKPSRTDFSFELIHTINALDLLKIKMIDEYALLQNTPTSASSKPGIRSYA